MHGGFDSRSNHSSTRFLLMHNSTSSMNSPTLRTLEDRRDNNSNIDRAGPPSARGFHSAVYVPGHLLNQTSPNPRVSVSLTYYLGLE